MALGTENTYYDAAWTNNYSKFTTTKPPVEEQKEVDKETTKEPEKKTIIKKTMITKKIKIQTIMT